MPNDNQDPNAQPNPAPDPNLQHSTDPNAQPDPNATDPSKGQTPWYTARISEVSNQRNQERSRAEAAEASNAALLTELTNLRKGGSQPASQLPVSSPTPAPTSTPQAASSGPSQAEINAMATAEARKMVAQQQFDESCNKMYDQGVKEFPDFQQKLNTYSMLGGMPPAFMEAVASLPDGHKVLHSLANNPDEARRVMSLPPMRMAIEVAQAAGRLKVAALPTPSNAPAPITPVHGSAKGSVDFYNKETPTEDWIAARNADLRARGKRV